MHNVRFVAQMKRLHFMTFLNQVQILKQYQDRKQDILENDDEPFVVSYVVSEILFSQHVS